MVTPPLQSSIGFAAFLHHAEEVLSQHFLNNLASPIYTVQSTPCTMLSCVLHVSYTVLIVKHAL